MPRCIKCGNVYSSKFISGVCGNCAGAVAMQPSPQKRSASSSAEISVGRYEEEVAKHSKPQRTTSKPRRNQGFNAVILTIFVFMMLAGLSLSYMGYGLTRHFVIWSIALVFFFVGSAMIATKRILVGRGVHADAHAAIEPAAASSVGGLCLLPLVMCTFYYSFSTDLPTDRAIWMVGTMSFVAFLAILGVAFALSRPGEAGA